MDWWEAAYALGLAASVAAGCAAWRGGAKWAWLCGLLATAGCAAVVVHIWQTAGRPPLSGAYESFTLLCLILNLLAFTALGGDNASRRLAGLTWLAVGLVLLSLLIAPRRVNPDWFQYHYFWTRAFFLLRVAALGFLVHGSLAALVWDRSTAAGGNLLDRSRRLLIWGTALFLAGELSGFYWCLNWQGDYWRWNRNFLESTLIFLVASAALHLPPRLAGKTGLVRTLYAAPGLAGLSVWLIHQVTESL